MNEDDLEISLLEAEEIPCDNDAEISISLECELRNPGKLETIVEQFDVFTAYLNGISRE
jgi:hypothetical protein